MTTDVLDVPEKMAEPLYSVAEAAKQVGVTPQTLKVYRKHGFISPQARGKIRLYSANDIKWMCCLREMIHVDKLSIEAVKILLKYASCWELRKCLTDERERCLNGRNGRLPWLP